MTHRSTRERHPITALFALLGGRWALRVLWELRNGPMRFRPLLAACGNAPSGTVNTRLAELRRAGIVNLGEDGYTLTGTGEALGRQLLDLNDWSKSWKEAWSWQADPRGAARRKAQ